MSDPLVSICCITYNHRDFIGDAIESFLAQKTNFGIELLIHDDASTDGTADIIRSYEKKYPELIKPIYQTENQHSKGLKVIPLNNNRAKGKYIAICEGDDYWVDPYKLQNQVDYMETHPECSLCVHAAFMVLPDKKKLRTYLQASQCDKVFTADEVIAGDGGLFATNSMMYPAKFNELPSFFNNAPVGDYPLTIFLAMSGEVFYMNDFMSAYRVGVRGSWSDQMRSDAKARITFYHRMVQMLDQINEYSKYKYDDAIKLKIIEFKLQLSLENGAINQIREDELLKIYHTLGKRTRVKIFIAHHIPIVLKVWNNIKRLYIRGRNYLHDLIEAK